MKKKILFLGLIMIMALTSCGIKNKKSDESTETMVKALTDEEFGKLEKYLEEYNAPLEGKVKAIGDQKKREVNIEVATTTTIKDPVLLKDTTVDLSNLINKDIAKDVLLNYYYEDDKDNLLLLVKDGKVLEDNFEKYLEEHPDKKESEEESSEMTAQEKTLMDAFIEGANSEANEMIKAEFDEGSKTVFIVLSEGSQITDVAAIRDTATKTSTDIMDIIGKGYTISVVFENNRENPAISVKDEEVLIDNL